VVITGAAKGIGRATAALAAEEGARVAICDILDIKGRRAAAEISRSAAQELGTGCGEDRASTPSASRFYHLDVTKEEEVARTFTLVSRELGPIFGLVNNAGVFGPPRPLHQVSEKEWDAVFDVTVKGAFFCTKYAVRQMMEKRAGSIVNVSSTFGLVGSAWKFAPESYHGSRGAVRMMTKAEAVSYGRYNIRVNSIHPGYTETRPFRKIDQVVIRRIPMARGGQPIEIAKCIVFLLSDDSSYMTGSELVVDGGYTAI
jgi:NAD(P)-dependent dehydrogenase (short-subunit alcohol dehydrogenase family)